MLSLSPELPSSEFTETCVHYMYDMVIYDVADIEGGDLDQAWVSDISF